VRKICLYFDEDTMSSSLVKALRSRNVDVITVSEAHREGLADRSQLEWASSEGRVICSCNVGDFMQLHTEFIGSGKDHTGIILMQQKLSATGDRLRGLMKIIETKTAQDMHNQLEFLSKYLLMT
jgi:hypothetical protein